MGPASTFMDAMPPAGWPTLATVDDIDRLRVDFAELQRNLFLGLIATQTAFAGLLIGVVKYLVA